MRYARRETSIARDWPTRLGGGSKSGQANANSGGSGSAYWAGGRGNFNDRVRQGPNGADEKFHEGSVKLRIRAALQLGERVRGIASFFVRAVAGDGVVGVGDRDDASPQWNFLARHRVWIARAVEEFVVVQHHFADARERPKGIEDFRAKRHVRFHGLPLFRIERA